MCLSPSYNVCLRILTSTELNADPLCERGTLGKLFSEALAHVVIDIIGPEQLFECFGSVSQMLREDVANSSSLTHPLSQVRQLPSLSLDQRVVFSE